MTVQFLILFVTSFWLSKAQKDALFDCKTFFLDSKGEICDNNAKNPLTGYDPMIPPTSEELGGQVKIRVFSYYQFMKYYEWANVARIKMNYVASWTDPRLNLNSSYFSEATRTKSCKNWFYKIADHKTPKNADIWGPHVLSTGWFRESIRIWTAVRCTGEVWRYYWLKSTSYSQVGPKCSLINAEKYPHDERECTLTANLNPVFLIDGCMMPYRRLLRRTPQFFNNKTCIYYYDPMNIKNKKRYNYGENGENRRCTGDWDVTSHFTKQTQYYQNMALNDEDNIRGHDRQVFHYDIRLRRCGHFIFSFYTATYIFMAMLTNAWFFLEIESKNRYICTFLTLILSYYVTNSILRDVPAIRTLDAGSNIMQLGFVQMGILVLSLAWCTLGVTLVVSLQSRLFPQHPDIGEILQQKGGTVGKVVRTLLFFGDRNAAKDRAVIAIIDRGLFLISLILSLWTVLTVVIKS